MSLMDGWKAGWNAMKGAHFSTGNLAGSVWLKVTDNGCFIVVLGRAGRGREATEQDRSVEAWWDIRYGVVDEGNTLVFHIGEVEQRFAASARASVACYRGVEVSSGQAIRLYRLRQRVAV